jgi:hypothetical protein
MDAALRRISVDERFDPALKRSVDVRRDRPAP